MSHYVKKKVLKRAIVVSFSTQKYLKGQLTLPPSPSPSLYLVVGSPTSN